MRGFIKKNFIINAPETQNRHHTDRHQPQHRFNHRSFWLTVLLALALSAGLWHASASGLSAQSGYSDVADSDKHSDAITALQAAGVLADDECDSGQFCPDDDLDRRALVTWLIRSLGADDSLQWLEKRDWSHLKLELSFNDDGSEPDKDELAKQLAMWALGLDCRGVTMDDCLSRPVSRQQAAPFIVLAFNVPEAPPAGFVDLGSNNQYEEAIDRLAAAGIVKACSPASPRYCPDDILSRAETASLLAEAEHWRNPPPVTPPGPEEEKDGDEDDKSDETEKETESNSDNGDEGEDEQSSSVTEEEEEEEDEDEDEEAEEGPNGNPPATPEAEEDEDEDEETLALPGTPTNVGLSLDGADGIAVVWQAPDSGGEVAHYRLAWRSKGNTAWTSGSDLPAASRSSAIAGLQPSETYEVTVTASNETGSTASQAEEIAIPLPMPGQPRDSRVDSLSASRFVVHWKEPDGGGAVSQYSIQWRGRHQGFSDSRRQLLTPDELTTVGTAPERMFSLSLNKRNVYMVRVAAVNASGTTVAAETLVPTKSTQDYPPHRTRSGRRLRRGISLAGGSLGVY